MTDGDDFRSRFEEAAGGAARDADALLEDELETLLEATEADLERLAPEVTDRESYQELVAVVEEATQRNLAISEFKQRIEDLGQGAVSLAKSVAGRLPV